jgi:hypothetical protein
MNRSPDLKLPPVNEFDPARPRAAPCHAMGLVQDIPVRCFTISGASYPKHYASTQQRERTRVTLDYFT